MNILEKKIIDSKITVGIIGMGYVGLELLINLAKKKNKIYGFDNDIRKINSLKKNNSYINYIPNQKIKEASNYSTFESSLNKIKLCDIIIMCLPTPLGPNKTPDLSFIRNATQDLKKYLRKNQLIILESTTYPGTTQELLVDELKRQFKVGKDFFIGYSPERIDPGRAVSQNAVPKLVSGYSQQCLRLVKLFYSQCFETVSVSNLKTAEITKLFENIYRSVNIGLVNEMKIICDKLDINIHEVIKAAKTKPYGFKAFYPGPGLGGHCVPIDPFYLSWKVKSMGINTRFIELAGEINSKMPSWIVEKVQEIFNQKKIALSQSKILLMGLSYKKNINDLRESPSIEIYKLLKKYKSKIDICDSYCDPNEIKKLFGSAKLFVNNKNIKYSKYSGVVIATDHDNFDYNKILKESKIVIDTRGRLLGQKSSKIFFI